MTLQPAVKNLLDQINAAYEAGVPKIEEMSVQENRDGLFAFYKDLVGKCKKLPK